MSGRSDYLATCTPRQDLLICQMCWEQFLLTGLLSLEGFWVQRRVLDPRCATVASRLLLPIIPPTVELGPRYGLQ
jgi:hypothetical protein